MEYSKMICSGRNKIRTCVLGETFRYRFSSDLDAQFLAHLTEKLGGFDIFSDFNMVQLDRDEFLMRFVVGSRNLTILFKSGYERCQSEFENIFRFSPVGGNAA